MNDVTFYGDSWDEYQYWQVQDKKTLKKINALIDDIDELQNIKILSCKGHYNDK